MSTRCNIRVKVGKSVVWLYRHCDGYLSETGADLAEKIQAAWGTENAHRDPVGAANHFMHAIFAESYAATNFRPATPVYELTSDLHGDISYLYQVEFTEAGAKVGYAKRNPGDENWAALQAFAKPVALSAFVSAVKVAA